MSSTPLMTEYPVDKKEVGGPILPAYRIDDSDVELIVGSPEPRSRCFWARFRRGGCQGGACAERKLSPRRRFVRWLFTAFLIFGLAGLFFKHRLHHHAKRHPIICEPVTEQDTSLTLPLHKWTKVALASSLSSNDVKITHSDEVEAGHVKISFSLPDDSEFIDEEDEPKIFVCRLVGPHVVGVGIHAKPAGHEGQSHKELKHHGDHPEGKHHKGPKAVSTIVTLPAEEAGHARGVDLLKPFRHHKWGKHGCHKKRVRKALHKALQKLRADRLAKLVGQPEDAE